MFADEVIINVDVFGVGCDRKGIRNVESALVVTEKRKWLR